MWPQHGATFPAAYRGSSQVAIRASDHAWEPCNGRRSREAPCRAGDQRGKMTPEKPGKERPRFSTVPRQQAARGGRGRQEGARAEPPVWLARLAGRGTTRKQAATRAEKTPGPGLGCAQTMRAAVPLLVGPIPQARIYTLGPALAACTLPLAALQGCVGLASETGLDSTFGQSLQHLPRLGRAQAFQHLHGAHAAQQLR